MAFGFKGFFGLFGKPEPAKGVQTNASTSAVKPAMAVNTDTALTVSTVWACITLLAETLSTLTLQMYVIDGDKRTKTKDHSLSSLLRHKPNRYQTRIEFFCHVWLNILTSGNAFILKSYRNGKLISLDVINTASVKVTLDAAGDIKYTCETKKGAKKEYTDKDIWHFKSFGDGLMGMSPISYGAASIGVSLAADKLTSDIMQDGGKASGVVGMDGWPGEIQREAIRTQMEELLNGGSGASIAVLGGGSKWMPISITPKDIELLATRRFSTEEICRFFWRIPSVLINDTSASTVWGSGIGEIVEGFYKFTLRPALERIENSMLVHLVDRVDWDKYEIEFRANDLLRASITERITANQVQVYSGQMTVNEARIEEGRSPISGGDITLIPLNMTTIDLINNPQATAANGVNNA